MIKYSVEKSSQGKYYILWKNVECGKGFNAIRVFKGTRRDCYQKLKEVKENGKELLQNERKRA